MSSAGPRVEQRRQREECRMGREALHVADGTAWQADRKKKGPKIQSGNK